MLYTKYAYAIHRPIGRVLVNLADLLLRHPFAARDDLLHDVDRSVTAGDARARAGEIAVALRDAGVEANQPVAVCLEDGIDTVLTMFGVWLAGAVFVPVKAYLAKVQGGQQKFIPGMIMVAAIERRVGGTILKRRFFP